jgi:hypothetical protein
MEKAFTPTVEQIIKRVTIDKLDNVTVSIYNGHFNFMYTIADSVVKDEFKGKYEYIGGLQCNYENDSEMYNSLEKELRGLAKRILNK